MDTRNLELAGVVVASSATVIRMMIIELFDLCSEMIDRYNKLQDERAKVRRIN